MSGTSFTAICRDRYCQYPDLQLLIRPIAEAIQQEIKQGRSRFLRLAYHELEEGLRQLNPLSQAYALLRLAIDTINVQL